MHIQHLLNWMKQSNLVSRKRTRSCLNGMNVPRKFGEYETLQQEVVDEIVLSKNAVSIEDIAEEVLWQIDETLNSGWKIYPHGEHLSCISKKSVKIEIPLYVSGCIGIDPGHFDDYLSSIGVSRCGCRAITRELEKLEFSNKAKRVNPEGTAAVWKLN